MRRVHIVGKDLEDDGRGSDDSSESDASSADSETALEQSRAKVKELKEHSDGQRRTRTIFRTQVGLAMSVATWVLIFGLPMFYFAFYKFTFGRRGSVLASLQLELERDVALGFNGTDKADKLSVSCKPGDSGAMRNLALARDGGDVKLARWDSSMTPWSEKNSTDIWCGWFNQHYLDYWPNVAQLIIFSVFQNTGTTINLAWQGIVGTYFACLNVALMQLLYPHGAAGNPCGTAGTGFTTIFRVHGVFFWKTAKTFFEAKKVYDDHRFKGGLDLIAIFENNGNAVDDYTWYRSGRLWNRTQERIRELHGADCEPGTIVHKDKHYNQWICLLDVIGVLFLFLISRSAKNTIMFGMSWHVCFMMDFMNPSIGVEPCYGLDCVLSVAHSIPSAVFKTTLMGAVVSILAALTVSLVLPISNLSNLEADSTAMTQAVTGIWNEGMDYLLTAKARSARRFHIATRISEVQDVVAKASTNADGAWWETLDMGRCGAKRRLLEEYDSCAADIRDMLSCVSHCIVTEDFKGLHVNFCSIMKDPMLALQGGVEELMYMTLQACKDGNVSGQESRVIQHYVREVMDKQAELYSAFCKLTPKLSRDLAEEVVAAFAISFWARKVTDFSERMAVRRPSLLSLFSGAFVALWQSFRRTWSIERMFCDQDHLHFALRNCLSISLVFCVAYFMPSGSVFVQYNATMPTTLTLLLVSETTQLGSMIHKNFNRLLAVVLGKVLPVMITWMLFFFPCLSTQRFVIQALATWLYIFMFTFVYYASPTWGYVGCLIAGFGVYQLLTPCTGDPSGTFESRYEEIGAVTFAILVQAVIHTALNSATPVQLQLKVLQKLSETLAEGYKAFFENDLESVQAAARAATTQIAQAQGLLPECDPALKVIKYDSRDFKLALCKDILGILHQLISDMNLLIIGAKDWVPNESVKQTSKAGDVVEILNSLPAMEDIRHEFVTALEHTSELMMSVLANDDERSKTLIDIPASMTLEAAPALFSQAKERLKGAPCGEWNELTSEPHARINVMVRALENAQFRLFKIAQRCLAE